MIKPKEDPVDHKSHQSKDLFGIGISDLEMEVQPGFVARQFHTVTARSVRLVFPGRFVWLHLRIC